MIKVVIGVALILWAISAGFGTREGNRAQIFRGPVGSLVNLLVFAIGAGLLVWAFF